jgi:hypothetical protein
VTVRSPSSSRVCVQTTKHAAAGQACVLQRSTQQQPAVKNAISAGSAMRRFSLLAVVEECCVATHTPALQQRVFVLWRSAVARARWCVSLPLLEALVSTASSEGRQRHGAGWLSMAGHQRRAAHASAVLPSAASSALAAVSLPPPLLAGAVCRVALFALVLALSCGPAATLTPPHLSSLPCCHHHL